MVKRVDNDGTTVWTKTFGTSDDSLAFTVAQVMRIYFSFKKMNNYAQPTELTKANNSFSKFWRSPNFINFAGKFVLKLLLQPIDIFEMPSEHKIVPMHQTLHPL